MNSNNYTRRGELILPTGQVLKALKIEDDMRDDESEGPLNNSLDSDVASILREIEEDRAAGVLAPFREGEHIGKLPRRVARRRLTDKAVREYNQKRKEWARADMLRLREKNDAAIRDWLRKPGRKK